MRPLQQGPKMVGVVAEEERIAWPLAGCEWSRSVAHGPEVRVLHSFHRLPERAGMWLSSRALA